MGASIANGTALRTIAIPLRKTTTSGRTKYMYFHNSAAFKKKPRQTRESRQGNNKKRPVESPRQTAVKLTVCNVHGDFETETHVACCWCLPFHGVSPLSAADYGES
jgi:hypothetical protein